MTVFVFAALLAGGAFLRLREGPVSVNALLPPVLATLNAGEGGPVFDAGQAVFSMGRPGRPSGIRLREVSVRDADGRLIAEAPQVAVRFQLYDLLQGRFRPTSIVLEDMTAELRRLEDGRLSLDLGVGPESAGAQAGAGGDGKALLGLLGPEEGGAGRLRRIEGRDLRLRYRDERAGLDLEAEAVSFVLRRSGDGVHGALTAALPLDDGPPARMRLRGRRMDADGASTILLHFEGLRPDAAASRVAALSSAPPGEISGDARARLDPDWRLAELSGSAAFAPAPDEPAAPDAPLRRGSFDFSVDADTDTLRISGAEASGAAGELAFDAEAKLLRSAEGALSGARLDAELSRLVLGVASGFEAPHAFRGGSAAARIDLEPFVVEVERATLADDDVTLEGRGRIALGDEGFAAEGRVTGSDLPAEGLVPRWPVAAAPGARDWVEENIKEGTVDSFEIAFAAGNGAPSLDLSFRFSGVRSTFLEGMAPIEAASGEGRATLERFDIALDEGVTIPPGGEPIDVAGSSFAIPDLTAPVEVGEPDVTGRGRIEDFLRLIDQPPLELTSKLDADLGPVGGVAEVRARVRVPLLKDLKLEEVGVDVTAALRDVRLKDPALGLDVRAETASLQADVESLRLEGDAQAEGHPLNLVWVERFSPQPGAPRTELAVTGRITGELLRSLGDDRLRITDGAARGRLDLRLGSVEGLTFDATLDDAAIEVDGIGWEKPRGAPGELSVEAAIDGRALDIRDLRLSAPGLSARGSARIAADGALDEVAFSSLKLGEEVDVALKIRRRENGVQVVRVTGEKLDLRRLGRSGTAEAGERETDEDTSPSDDDPSSPDDAAASEGKDATRFVIDVRRLAMSDNVVLHEAKGDARTGERRTRAEVSGLINGGPPVDVAYRQGPNGNAQASVTAEDAGGVLEALGFFPSGEGGDLKIDARVPARSGAAVRGSLRIDGMFVRSDSAMTRLLSKASVLGVIEDLGSGGMRFVRIEAPFVLKDDVLTIDDATALGPSLGIKIGGAYNMETGRIAMEGVLTPAYAINGVLSQVPVLGEILGGAGEGLIGVTFAIEGQREDPDVSVNPFSALAPGVLRKLLSGGRPGAEDVGGTAPTDEPEPQAEARGEAAAATETPPPPSQPPTTERGQIPERNER